MYSLRSETGAVQVTALAAAVDGVVPLAQLLERDDEVGIAAGAQEIQFHERQESEAGQPTLHQLADRRPVAALHAPDVGGVGRVDVSAAPWASLE